MDPQHIAKFSEVRKSEYLSVEENCYQLKKFIADYEAVKSSVTSLSEKCRHPVMVPFGNVAFMRGTVVHTNDVLVLLGDNWFVERSAKQTADILGRRIDALQTEVGKLQTRMEQIRTELSYARVLLEEGGDTVEIVEPYDGDSEQKWRSQHNANIRKVRQESKEPNESADVNCLAAVDSTDYDEIWRRLEELEREEEEAEEDDDVEDKTDISLTAESTQKESTSDSDIDSDSTLEPGQPMVINFKHSTTGPQIRERCATLCSPADIYDRFCVQHSPAVSSVGTSLERSGKPQHSQLLDVSCETADSHVDPETQPSLAATDLHSSSDEPVGRKVSKFKASRMKK